MEDQPILDAENYRGNENYGYKEIVLRQLQRVVTNGSQEWRNGFWVYNAPAANMTPMKVRYVGDSRKEFKNSLDVLHDLLQPKFDETMTQESEEAYKTFYELHTKYLNKQVSEEERGTYWDTTLKIYRGLFQKICLFLERYGWLEGQEIEE